MSKMLVFLVCVAAASVATAMSAVFLPFGPRLALKLVSWHYRDSPFSLRAGDVRGTFAAGVELEKVELSGFSRLPAGASLTVQSVRFEPDLLRPLSSRLRFFNGKIQLPDNQIVSFAGSAGLRELDLNIFSPSLTISALINFFPGAKIRVPLSGIVRSIDVFVSGTPRQPKIMASLTADSLDFAYARAEEVNAQIELFLSGVPGKGLNGVIRVLSGKIDIPNCSIYLDPGQAVFKGDPSNPGLDFRGHAEVADTRISLFISGTMKKPDLQLNSLPALPRERLLLMLLTGSSWRSTEEAVIARAPSAEMTKEILDFFFLGGHASQLQAALGIEGISLTYNQTTRGFEVKKSLLGPASVIYGLSETREKSIEEERPAAAVSQKVGLEYKLPGGVSLQWSRQDSANQTAAPDEKVGVKFKRAF